MPQSIFVKLYFDQYSAPENFPEGSLVVTDVQSYATARQAIEVAKAGGMAIPLTIVVRSRHFYSGFHDLPQMEDLVEITEISPRRDLAHAFGVQIDASLTDQDLISLGIKSASDLQPIGNQMKSHETSSLDDALLAKALGGGVFQIDGSVDFDAWFQRLFDLFYSDHIARSPIPSISYFCRLANERITEALDHFGRSDLAPFIEELWHRAETGQARRYLSQLAVRYWLRSYPKLARKSVVANMTDELGSWQEIKGEALILRAVAGWCENLYARPDTYLCNEVEQVLALLFRDDGLIETEDLQDFIRQTSGRFASEYSAAIAHVVELLLDSSTDSRRGQLRADLSAYLAQLDERFIPLLMKSDRSLPTADWIGRLLEFGDVVDHLTETNPSRWEDWIATYELLIRARHLRGELQSDVPTDQGVRLADLYALFSTLDVKLNSIFADWLLSRYPELLTGNIERPRLVLHAARLALDSVASGCRTILLVLDALDWELWHHLRSAFGKEGFVVEGDDAGLAVLPSITEFSRRAIFGGLPPSTLASFVDDIYGTEVSPQEEAKTLARALGYLGRIDQLKPLRDSRQVQQIPGEMVYATGGERELRRALSLEAKCYAFVYTELDAHIHVSKLEESKLRSSVRQWLTDFVGQVVLSIRQNPILRDQANLRILVVSDHGFLDVSEQPLVELDRSLTGSVDLERHGRLAVVRAREGDKAIDREFLRQMVEQLCDRQPPAWYIIWRDQAQRFGLPCSSPSEGEVVAWLIPRLFRYVNKGKGNYVHGGLSMYETIVPLALLTRGQREAEAPAITLTGRLISEEESMLSIAVLNNDERPIRQVVISIPALGLNDLRMEDIGPASVQHLNAVVIPTKSGEMVIEVRLDGEMGGTRRQLTETRALTVIPGRRERMRTSTRRSFLDENN